MPTIMVVDDTPENLSLLATLLGGEGYRVQAFPNGPMALAAAVRRPPDLVLLDIGMPGMNGFEVCERFKEHAALREIPVIFITALTQTAEKVQAFDKGGVDYICKPFHFKEVLARVSTHLRLRDLNLRLQERVEAKTQEIEEAHRATVLALSRLADSRDQTTGGHIERTRSFCRALAVHLRRDPAYAAEIDDAFVDNIYFAAPLHDIGKVGIADSILLKPGRLTPEEMAIMKTHTRIGALTLEAVLERFPDNALMRMGAEIAGCHHECWDGLGYPEGLVGAEIPLSARIMAVADVYDALRSKRPYKEAMSHREVIDRLQNGEGRTRPSAFDPAVLAACAEVEQEFESIYTAFSDDALLDSDGAESPAPPREGMAATTASNRP